MKNLARRFYITISLMLAWMLAGGACRLHRAALWVGLAACVYAAVRLGLFAAGWVRVDGFIWLAVLVASLLFALWVDKTYGRLPGVVAEEGMKVRLFTRSPARGVGERVFYLMLPLLLVLFYDMMEFGTIPLEDASTFPRSGLEQWHFYIIYAHLMCVWSCSRLRGCATWVHEELPWLKRLHVAAVFAMLLYSLALFLYVQELILFVVIMLYPWILPDADKQPQVKRQ